MNLEKQNRFAWVYIPCLQSRKNANTISFLKEQMGADMSGRTLSCPFWLNTRISTGICQSRHLFLFCINPWFLFASFFKWRIIGCDVANNSTKILVFWSWIPAKNTTDSKCFSGDTTRIGCRTRQEHCPHVGHKIWQFDANIIVISRVQFCYFLHIQTLSRSWVGCGHKLRVLLSLGLDEFAIYPLKPLKI